MNLERLLLGGMLLLWLLAVAPAPAWAIPEVRIGVLAKRGAELSTTRWQPTADYLSERLPGHRFVIVPLDFKEIYVAVARHEVDFVLANSVIYVELEVRYGVSSVVTLHNRGTRGEGYTEFGGVIFTRADHADISSLRDLSGKRFAAVEENSFGGYLMALREFRRQGIKAPAAFKSLVFVGTHDAVVEAVLAGQADAGTVRSDTLEHMADEGKLDLARIKLLNVRRHPGFNFLVSTELYPEWPLARLRGTDPALGDRVASVLLAMSADDPAAIASRSQGWSVAGNYQPVHQMMRELRIGPYEELGEIRWRDLLTQYGAWVAVIAALLLLLALTNGYVGLLNRRLRRVDNDLRLARDSLAETVAERTRELRESNRRLALLLADWNDAFDAITHPIFIHDSTLRIVHANPAYIARAGLPFEEIEGRYYWEVYPKLNQPLSACAHFPERILPEGEELTLASGEVLISRSFAMKRADGSFGHAIHILEDVTEVRRAESRQRTFGRALEQAREGVLILDAEGLSVFGNRAFVALLGQDSGCPGGLPVEAVLRGGLPLPAAALLAQANRPGGWSGEMQLPGEAGPLPLLLTVSAIRNADGAVEGYVATLLDLSEIKRAEAALHYRVAVEALLGTLAARFLATDGTELDTAIGESLREIGTFVGVDRVYLFALEPDSEQPLGSHQWCRQDDLLGQFSSSFDLNHCPWLGERLRGLETVAIRDLADLPPEAGRDADYLGQRQVRSALLMPLHRAGRLSGFLGLDTVDARHDWSEGDQRLLLTSSEIIASAIGRHEAEARVRHSQASLNEAQHIAHLGNWEWDIVHNTLAWSDEIYRIFGVQPQEFGATYDAFLSYVHAADRQAVIDAVNRAVEQREAYAIDHRVVWADGTRRIVHEQGTVHYDAAGQPQRMLGTVQDVTDIRRHERELARLNRTLRTLSLGNSVLVHSRDERQLLTDLCRTLVESGGHPLVSVIASRDARLEPLTCHGRPLEHVAAMLADGWGGRSPLRRALGGNAHVIEHALARQDADWARTASAAGFASLMALPLKSGPDIFGVLAIFSGDADAFDDAELDLLQELADDLAFGIRALRDRQAGEAAQNALSESERRYHNLYDTAPTGYASVSAADGTILQCNPAYARILGRTPESLKGLPERDLYPPGPQGRERATPVFERFRQGQTVRDVELRMTRGDGSPVWVSLTVEPVFDSQGEVRESRASIIDISERKAAEIERHQFAERTERALLQTIEAIALTVEKRDPYTAGHQQRVAELAVAIGTRLGLDAHRVKGLRLGAMIHDIGKVYVPTEILNRPGKLDDAQFHLIRNHPLVGREIVQGIEFPWPLAEMVVQHHERLDGSGYPHGLKGEDILLEARILAVADVVEAMASHRPYRPSLHLDEALREIEQGRGSRFDGDVVDACLALFREGGFTWSSTWQES